MSNSCKGRIYGKFMIGFQTYLMYHIWLPLDNDMSSDMITRRGTQHSSLLLCQELDLELVQQPMLELNPYIG